MIAQSRLNGGMIVAFTILETTNKNREIQIPLKREILVDSQKDLYSIPSDTAAGSIAYTADLKHMWMKTNDGQWTEIGG